MRQDVESFSDFIQYYRGSYVKSRTEAETLYKVAGAGDAPDSVAVRKYVSGREVIGASLPWRSLSDTIFFGLPRLGTVVFRHELMFLYYRTVRNGSRGFNPGRVMKHSFNQADIASSEPEEYRSLMDYPPFVHKALRRDWIPWRTAAEDLVSESPNDIAYALSFNFGAYLPRSGPPRLTYKDTIVADFDSPNKITLRADCADYTSMIHRWVNNSIEVLTS